MLLRSMSGASVSKRTLCFLGMDFSSTTSILGLAVLAWGTSLPFRHVDYDASSVRVPAMLHQKFLHVVRDVRLDFVRERRHKVVHGRQLVGYVPSEAEHFLPALMLLPIDSARHRVWVRLLVELLPVVGCHRPVPPDNVVLLLIVVDFENDPAHDAPFPLRRQNFSRGRVFRMAL